jgi:hypothetical protein
MSGTFDFDGMIVGPQALIGAPGIECQQAVG